MLGRSKTDPIKVLLADNHTMFRQGIANVLADFGGMEIVGQTDNDERAVELARLTKPDVILMQVQMPIPRAREYLLRMREVSDPPPKVIIVTMIEDPRQIRELMDLGASAYIVKSASAEHLVAAVRAAIVDPKSQRNVVVGMPRALLEEAEEGSHGVLSARELEILLLAARGLSNRQIGASLHVAVGTVKRHLANAYQKMGVGSRGQATRMALHEEWITIQDVTDDLDGPEGNSSSEGSYSPSSSDSLLVPSSTPSNSSRETSLTSEVVPSSSTVASMRSVLRSRIRHSTSSGHLRSTPARAFGGSASGLSPPRPWSL